jgi:hypothetical protein
MSLCCRCPGHTPVTGNRWDVGAVARVCKRHGVRYPRRCARILWISLGRDVRPPKRTRLLLGFAHLLGMRPNYVADIQFFRHRHGLLKGIPRLCVALCMAGAQKVTPPEKPRAARKEGSGCERGSGAAAG